MPQPSVSELLKNPERRFHGAQSSALSDLYVSCQLLADNKPLTIPFRTSFKAFKNSYMWNGWKTLPIWYCDLPLSSQIPFAVWNIRVPPAVPVGGSTFRMFGKKWFVRENATCCFEQVNVDVTRFEFPVIFSESEAQNQGTIPFAPPAAQTPLAPILPSYFSTHPHLWAILDPEIAREKPVDDRHRWPVRSHQSSPCDRELKPDVKIRDELNEIINYAPSQPLNSGEKDLTWKFRFYLSRDGRGFTKIIKSVTWRDPSEVKQAVEGLLPMWRSTQMIMWTRDRGLESKSICSTAA
ncbi:hypothetical protein BDR05DRAFT_996232 [Suillus weaverae]|nr:hypothetical protein BDR05DRAFT_996232 [Suillus weaverae]